MADDCHSISGLGLSPSAIGDVQKTSWPTGHRNLITYVENGMDFFPIAMASKSAKFYPKCNSRSFPYNSHHSLVMTNVTALFMPCIIFIPFSSEGFKIIIKRTLFYSSQCTYIAIKEQGKVPMQSIPNKFLVKPNDE